LNDNQILQVHDYFEISNEYSYVMLLMQLQFKLVFYKINKHVLQEFSFFTDPPKIHSITLYIDDHA
jgi:hypothetical protein